MICLFKRFTATVGLSVNGELPTVNAYFIRKYMAIIASEKQKDNLSKFSYDAAKIILAILIIGPIARPEAFELHLFIVAVVVIILLILFGFRLDAREVIEWITLLLQ